MTGVARKSGFTLIELLVVVAIIVVLISILLPSLAKARERSKILVCQVNTRSIGQLLLQYSSENNQWLPPAGDWTASYLRLQNLDNTGYVQDVRMFRCPTDQINFTTWVRVVDGSAVHSSYKSESPQPSGPIQWIFDINRVQEFYKDQWGGDKHATEVLLAWDDNGYTHNGNYAQGFASYGYSALFADWHVEFVKKTY